MYKALQKTDFNIIAIQELSVTKAGAFYCSGGNYSATWKSSRAALYINKHIVPEKITTNCSKN